ncbi:hypothetical protein DIPPA_18316 [Diplonema papillatum]|nr:hypothetical protein DIPPA_18316 [Diplonema papillatum]|eukprot:gene8689-13443_t
MSAVFDNVDPVMLVGPVVGRVTDTTARILVEYGADRLACCTLVCNATKRVTEVEKQFAAEVPAVFHITGLDPDRLYSYTVSGDPEAGGSFRTLGGGTRAVRILFGSCDKPAKRGAVDLFDAMYNEYIANHLVDVVIRNGDQVYADSAFKECVAIWKGSAGLPAETTRKRMLQCYQKVYRRVWNEPSVARCYANCSHLMLLDDHEIRNDWGTFPNDDTVHHINFPCGAVGRQAYYLYQRQLWDEAIEPGRVSEYDPPFEAQCFRFNSVGVCLVDCRGSRTWCKIGNRSRGDAGDSWLGEAQWRYLKKSLGPGGELADAAHLVFVHSTPVAYLGVGASRALACCCPPQKDKVGFGLFPREQAAYLDWLRAWQRRSVAGKMGAQEPAVTLVGGDLHHHMLSFVSKSSDGDGEAGAGMWQIVASAISNSPPPKFARWLVKCFMCRPCGPARLADSWRVQHLDFHYERNFVLLERTDSATSFTMVTTSGDQVSFRPLDMTLPAQR